MHPNANLKVVYFQEGSATVMPLSQGKEGNKLFEITPDITLGELHRMGPKLGLCNFFKVCNSSERFYPLVFLPAAHLKLIRSRNRRYLF